MTDYVDRFTFVIHTELMARFISLTKERSINECIEEAFKLWITANIGRK